MNSRLFRFDFDRTHFGDHGLESSTISCPADTLYSALCVEALRMGGQQLLGELVACSTLRLTDLLPYVGPDYLVPKPLHSVRSDGSSMQKKLAKKIGFLPAAQLGSFLDGTADLKELAARQTKIGVHAVSAKAAIHNERKTPTRTVSATSGSSWTRVCGCWRPDPSPSSAYSPGC